MYSAVQINRCVLFCRIRCTIDAERNEDDSMQVQENQKREYKLLNGIFRFKADIQHCADKEHWEQGLHGARCLAVPASWNDQADELQAFFGTGWYEREIQIPESWKDKEILLRFEGVSIGCSVFLEGRLVGKHRGVGLPFEFPITSLVRPGGRYRLNIAVDGNLDPWDLPPARLDDGVENEGAFHFYPAVSYDYFPYAGIHRDIYLYAVNPRRVQELWIDTRLEWLPDRKAEIGCHMVLSQPVDGTLRITAISPGGTREYATCVTVTAAEGEKVSASFVLPQAELWDINTPNLYRLQLELFDKAGTKLDEYFQTFGIRKVEIRGDKLLLNGKAIFLRGFGKHEDFFLSGKGIQPAVMVKDYERLQWIGANSYRTSHYPYDPAYLDYADSHGILVIAETPFVGLMQRMYTQQICDRACGIIREMIQRDANHPSVIMWSLANEPVVQSQEGKEFFRQMAQTARACDPTRPLTYAAHMEPEDNLGMEFFDVIGINKYYGWYDFPGELEKGTQCLLECMDRFYAAFHKPLLLTEFGADAMAGMHSQPPRMFSEEYQSELLKKQYTAAKTRPYCIGAHIWAFADFQTPQAVNRMMGNRKGVFTRDREPKMAAYTLKALWNLGDQK